MSYVEQTIVTALSGLSAKVYPLVKPEGKPFPCIVYRRVTQTDLFAHGEVLDLNRARVQLTAWDDSYADAKALAEQVKGVLNGNTTAFEVAQLVDQKELTDPDGMYGIIMDFFVWSKGD